MPSNLPKSLFGFMPLYIAVELALGITILNKCSGAYGILALFTGHPLDAMQWITYVWSVLTLIVYAQGLFQVVKPDLLVFSQILVTFTIDTVFTCFMTVWFTAIWFQLEDSKTKPNDAKANNQGASEGYEYFGTIFITLATLTFRAYFNLLLTSFVQELLHHPKFLVDYDDVELNLKNKTFIRRWWIKSQTWSYRITKRILS